MIFTAQTQVPHKAQRIRREAVGIVRGNRRWNGSWIVEGDMLRVESAYGSRAIKAGAEATRALRAEKLLGEIVDARVRP